MHKSKHLGRQSLLIVAGQRNLFFWRVNLQVWATRNTQPHPRNIFAVHITCKLVPVQFSLRTGFPGKWWILAGCTQLFLALSACCSQRPSFVLSMLPTVAHPQTSDMVVTVEGVSVIFALVPSWDTGAITDIAYKDGHTNIFSLHQGERPARFSDLKLKVGIRELSYPLMQEPAEKQPPVYS